MVNSFNEWNEDTQIERSIAAPRTNVDDSGTQRYTERYFYEGYGNGYLHQLYAATILEPPSAVLAVVALLAFAGSFLRRNRRV